MLKEVRRHVRCSIPPTEVRSRLEYLKSQPQRMSLCTQLLIAYTWPPLSIFVTVHRHAFLLVSFLLPFLLYSFLPRAPSRTSKHYRDHSRHELPHELANNATANFVASEHKRSTEFRSIEEDRSVIDKVGDRERFLQELDQPGTRPITELPRSRIDRPGERIVPLLPSRKYTFSNPFFSTPCAYLHLTGLLVCVFPCDPMPPDRWGPSLARER